MASLRVLSKLGEQRFLPARFIVQLQHTHSRACAFAQYRHTWSSFVVGRVGRLNRSPSTAPGQMPFRAAHALFPSV